VGRDLEYLHLEIRLYLSAKHAQGCGTVRKLGQKVSILVYLNVIGQDQLCLGIMDQTSFDPKDVGIK